MAVIYENESIYLESCTSLESKIEAIDAIIDALMVAAAAAAGTEGVKEYWLNDGQIQIKKIYSGTSSIFAAIKDFEKLRQMYINRRNGNVVRLIDSKNLTGGRYGGR
jgi:hypothetical protein